MGSNWSFERRILLLALLGGLPGSLLSIILLFTSVYSWNVRITTISLLILIWVGFALAVKSKIRFALQTLANVLSAMREGDYSLRIREGIPRDAMGELIHEINTFGAMLKDQRLGAMESTALLRTIMAEITDMAVFAFDQDARLCLVNGTGEKLLGEPANKLLGQTATRLKLAEYLECEQTRTVQLSFAGVAGRWEIRRSTFREQGKSRQLLLFTDLSRPLREEEKAAWQRLIRVLAHELNNSLAPIKSLSGSLESLVLRDPLPHDWKEDMQRGLSIIGNRAEALCRFTDAYSRIARLPPPNPKPLNVEEWIQKVPSLETRIPIRIISGPKITIQADADQMDQLLINLLRNAADAVLEAVEHRRNTKTRTDPPGDSQSKVDMPGATISWNVSGRILEMKIIDDGLGISSAANLFVPFFTTKKNGSGIGLALCRQIAEAHGGSLTIKNREDAPGCVVLLTLMV